MQADGVTQRRSYALQREGAKIPLCAILINILILALIQINSSSIYISITENAEHQLHTSSMSMFTDKNVCNIAKQDFRKASKLSAIVTGTAHSGTTIISQLIMSAPNIYGAQEGGLLLASEPSKFKEVSPFYAWTMKSTINKFWGLSNDQRDLLLNSTCHAEMYVRLRRYSSLFFHPPNEESWILDKTPAYIRNLVDVMDRSPGVPVVVTEKSYHDQRASLKKRNVKNYIAKIIITAKDDSLREALKKYPNRIHIVNMTALYLDPNVVMGKVFDFLGLEWQPEYLTMEALNSKRPIGSLKTLPFNATASVSSQNTERFS